MVNIDAWKELKQQLDPKNITLVAVSKTKPVSDIMAFYDQGQKDFGENYVQELVEKAKELPKDIRWHFIGHLQTNKVKQIVPFVHLIHSVDRLKLLEEIDKQAKKVDRVIDVLLQVYIAEEETKFGLDEKEVVQLLDHYSAGAFKNVRIRGMMGMASFSEDLEKVRLEFRRLANMFTFFSDTVFLGNRDFNICSIGMTGDYHIAIEEGSTMVRIGSMLFGARNKN